MLFGPQGEVLEWRRDGPGGAEIAPGGWEAAAGAMIGDWAAQYKVPIVMAGMVGTRHGWNKVDYVPCPARPADLASAALSFDCGLGRIVIIPGLSLIRGDGTADVMRGEEVQLLGAGVEDGLVVCPGTHCKWVWLEAGRVIRFRSYMTGELFALLSRHSMLAPVMGGTELAQGPQSDQAFERGVELALGECSLSALLFTLRAGALLDLIPADHLADYLSGLLIGSEVAEERQRPIGSATLICEAALTQRYRQAFAMAGIAPPQAIDGETASARGLWRLGQYFLNEAK